MSGIKFSIGADSSKAQRELSHFEKKTRKIVSSIAKGFQERIGHKLFDGMISAARSVPGAIGEAIESASSLNEEISKSETIFGSSSAEIQKWAKGAADAMGLSELAALEATGVIGNMFTAMGMSGDEAAKMSRSMVELASDLGSFNNTSTEDAIEAIGAALRGESEPIRRYGVLLDDATLKAEAFAKGLYDGKGSLDPATRALSAYSVILKQTTAAQGDFQKTSDGLANSKKILTAQFENASAKIGEAFLPAMQALVDFMNEADIDSFAEGISSLVTSFVDLASSIKDAYLNALDLLGILPNVQKEIPDMSRFASEFERPTRTDEDERFDRGTKALLDASDREKALQIQDQVIEKNKEESKSIWQIIQDTKTLADEKIKAIRAEIAEKTKQEKSFISMREAEALAEFGMGGAAVKANRLQELAGMGITGQDAEEIASRESDLNKLMRTNDLLSSMASRSSVTAVSSMQSIGGGGGFSTELDIQKTQTKLQEQMVTLLSDIRARQSGNSISDY